MNFVVIVINENLATSFSNQAFGGCHVQRWNVQEEIYKFHCHKDLLNCGIQDFNLRPFYCKPNLINLCRVEKATLHNEIIISNGYIYFRIKIDVWNSIKHLPLSVLF